MFAFTHQEVTMFQVISQACGTLRWMHSRLRAMPSWALVICKQLWCGCLDWPETWGCYLCYLCLEVILIIYIFFTSGSWAYWILVLNFCFLLSWLHGLSLLFAGLCFFGVPLLLSLFCFRACVWLLGTSRDTIQRCKGQRNTKKPGFWRLVSKSHKLCFSPGRLLVPILNHSINNIAAQTGVIIQQRSRSAHQHI